MKQNRVIIKKNQICPFGSNINSKKNVCFFVMKTVNFINDAYRIILLPSPHAYQ